MISHKQINILQSLSFKGNPMLRNSILPSTLLAPFLSQFASNVFNDPLAQFEVLSFSMIKECAMFTNVAAYLMITVLTIYCFLAIFAVDQLNAFSFLTFLLHGLVKNIVKENLYIKTQIYYGNIFFLFLMLLTLNVLGLLPYSFTATSSAIVTLFLSASHFVAINLIAVHKARWEAGSMFLPGGSPLAIIGLLIPIEFISYVARLFSLSIRLFANMLSGHALLKILIGFS